MIIDSLVDKELLFLYLRKNGSQRNWLPCTPSSKNSIIVFIIVKDSCNPFFETRFKLSALV